MGKYYHRDELGRFASMGKKVLITELAYPPLSTNEMTVGSDREGGFNGNISTLSNVNFFKSWWFRNVSNRVKKIDASKNL